jgi:hypothetical protein
MIQLGTCVRDILTGLTGVAVARTEWLYGCTRIAIEPIDLKKDGKPSDSVWFDEQRVEKCEDQSKALSFQPARTSYIKLGSKVKDSLTGFKGLATAKTVWLSGNVNITIEPEELFEGKPIQPHAFESDRILVTELQPVPMSSTANKNAPGEPQDDPRNPY